MREHIFRDVLVLYCYISVEHEFVTVFYSIFKDIYKIMKSSDISICFHSLTNLNVNEQLMVIVSQSFDIVI